MPESANPSTSAANDVASQRGRAKRPPTSFGRFLNWLERLIFPLAILTGVIGIVYWYWTTTPTYALTSVVMSVKNHDSKTFEKYVDLDSITGHAFDDLVDGPARSVILGRYDSLIGAGFLHFFKNDIVGIAHDKVIGFINDNKSKLEVSGGSLGWLPMPIGPGASGTSNNNGSSRDSTAAGPQHSVYNNLKQLDAQTSFLRGGNALVPAAMAAPTVQNAQAQPLPATEPDSDMLQTPALGHKIGQQLKDYGLSKNGFKGIKYLDVSGNIALLGLEFYSPKLNQSWVAEFKMEDVGGYWRVTEIANLNQLVDKYLVLRDRS